MCEAKLFLTSQDDPMQPLQNSACRGFEAHTLLGFPDQHDRAGRVLTIHTTESVPTSTT